MNKDDLDPQKLARARNAFAAVPYAKFLGLQLGEVRPGEVSIHLSVRDELKQNQGVVHGGAIASLIDTASAFAVLTQVDVDERVTTTDLTIHYLRPVTSGRMTATARIIRGGRRLFVLSVDVHDHADALIATAVTTYIKIDKNPSKS
jgi:acyl-CoA thioesterase